MYTLPAAPPPVASVAAESPAALHRAGEPAADDVGAAVASGVAVPVGLAESVLVGVGLAELVPGSVVDCCCGSEGPHPASTKAAAAAAVAMTKRDEFR
jgi:hypothetical protein